MYLLRRDEFEFKNRFEDDEFEDWRVNFGDSDVLEDVTTAEQENNLKYVQHITKAKETAKS